MNAKLCIECFFFFWPNMIKIYGIAWARNAFQFKHPFKCKQRVLTSAHYASLSSAQIASPNLPLRDRFSVAPMMDYTDMHQRYLMRLLSRHAVLYTEMVTSYSLVHSPTPDRFLCATMPFEEPVVLQLGGSDPEYVRKAARLAFDYGYREFNINAGCPSEKVAGAGNFGASLMLNPQLVGVLVNAIKEETGCRVTVKCRIGVNDNDSYEELVRFVDAVRSTGNVTHFIVHARKAILGKKFSPADNRKIPPLKYDYVHKLVQDFPYLQFTINGGFMTIEECREQLDRHGVHGVMVGRAVTNYPFHWRNVDSVLYGHKDPGAENLYVYVYFHMFIMSSFYCYV
ncbi:tRNA dihydrouridine(20/20a) synthase DusA [archaeon]|nr:MAG: tRNA dihydrouridine(20/20a) synthase DusA [archaeon]